MKIVCTGPECSGKSTLCEAIAGNYKLALVQEVARTYLELSNNVYNKNSLAEIARLQIKEEEKILLKNNDMVCDTDILTIIIWSMEKYGDVKSWMIEHFKSSHVDMYLLCKPDIPWIYDPQRCNPNDRERLFFEHQKLLNAFNKPYLIVRGELPERLGMVHELLIGLQI